MGEPIKIMPSGFEVWRKDRTTGRDMAMTRVDEDRFCDVLREAFGKFQVVKMNGSWPTPEVEWRARITDFGSQFHDYSNPAVARNVGIMFPWPGWELMGEKLSWDIDGPNRPQRYRVTISSPLSIIFERSALLGTDILPQFDWWDREVWVAGRYYVPYCSEGPYVEAQKAFIGKLRRIVGKMTTNKLKVLRFDENGRPVDVDPTPRRPIIWAADDAVRWAREDESRLLTEMGAPIPENGIVRFGYRPLD